MTEVLKLPVVDLSSPDRSSTAACTDYGFFYPVNHGVEELFQKVFEESKKLFFLPLDEKMKMARKNRRGYTSLFAENLDPESSSKDVSAQIKLNQWPSEEILPSWRPAMETIYRKVLDAGKRLLALIAVAMNLDEDFFVRVGAIDKPAAYLRLLHYPGELGSCNEETYGASAHSHYGMITLLASNGVQGLQVCREKFKQPRVLEDVLHLDGFPPILRGDYPKERIMLTSGSQGGLKNTE
ncbi:hypothetical protein UlMin_001599 [Ulmus minor]